MGIKGLSKLLQEVAPESIKEESIKAYFGRKIAVDASMALYQFLIAVRQSGPGGQLTNESGEVTSHLVGLFYRTIRMMDNGIKPVYVFDGKPPLFKGDELRKRRENREKAEKERQAAEEEGDAERQAQMEKRLTKVSPEHVADCKRLLTCMGVPWVQAAGEAEAQCAAMAKAGIVYACATEDMDALTFATPKLVRHMTYTEARKMPIQEFDYQKVLSGLDLTREQFVDMCILCGCDYVPSVRGIGPKKAYQFIRKHKSIEAILKHLDTDKYIVPDGFLFEEARKLFNDPDLADCKELQDSVQWKDADEEATVQFLVDEKGFAKERVLSGLRRLKASKSKSAQKRLDTFFKPMANLSIGKKRKRPKGKENSKKNANKKRRT